MNGQDSVNITEKKTVEKMIRLYCANHHAHPEGLCEMCSSLKEYAWRRLSTCQFGNKKPSCKKCKVHCFSPEMKEQVKKVMRYSGPYMIWQAPFLTFRYLLRNILRN